MKKNIEIVRPKNSQLSNIEQEVREGLTKPLPEIPCKYFYDDRGSQLFDQITQLQEYYQTRTELSIIQRIASNVVDRFKPEELVELGSGVGLKIRTVLSEMSLRGLLKKCTFFDINETFLVHSVAELVEIYPHLRVRGIIADFIHHLDLIERTGKQLILFFAGTIGNLHPKDEVPTFLQRLAKQVLPSDGLLIGIDLVKDVRRLEEAYNDAKGVTAAFNLNILNVINNRLDANFNTEEFEHVAFYDTDNNWIEMRLRALCDTRVDIAGCDLSLVFREGEEIKTEISCKYTRESFEETVLKSGLKVTNWYTDDEKLFALCQLEVF